MAAYDLDRINHIRLDTDAKQGHYKPQVFAISQTHINHAFTGIWEATPGIGAIDFESAQYGKLKGQLAVPDHTDPIVIIDLSQKNACGCLVKLRFQSGEVYVDQYSSSSLTGWVLTLRCDLNERVIKDNPIMQHGLIAGEYSPHRLLAVLCAATWSDPDKDLSLVKDPGTGELVTYRVWEKKSHDNQRLLDGLSRLLAAYFRSQLKSYGNQLGLLFELPLPWAVGPDVALPTNTPYRMSVQTYVDAQQVSQGHYNCLVFGEDVEGDVSDPQDLKLPYSGNFAWPVPGTLPNVLGTVVLDHRSFLEKYILQKLEPQFQVCEIPAPAVSRDYVSRSVVGYDTPYCWADDYIWPTSDSMVPAVCRKWTMGMLLDPDGKRIKPPSDGYFRLKASGVGKYTWDKSYPVKLDAHKWERAGFQRLYNKYDGSSSCNVDVTWKAGESKLSVSIVPGYREESHFSLDNDSSWDRSVWSLWSSKLSWTYEIDLTIPRNGVIQPKLAKSYFLHRDGDVYQSTRMVSTAGQSNFRRQLEKEVIPQLKALYGQLDKEFESKPFVCSGWNELEFGPPVFNDVGDLVCSVRYLPADSDAAKKARVRVPIRDKTPSGTKPAGSTEPKKPVVDADKLLHLTWTCAIESFDSSTNLAKLTMTGTNDREDEALGFGYVSVSFPPTKETELSLFNSLQWNDKATAPADETVSSTYVLKTEGVAEAVELLPETANMNLSARIHRMLPGGRSQGVKDAFVVRPGGSIKIEFEAQVDGPGTYYFQIHESWVDPDPMESSTRTGASDLYKQVVLEVVNAVGSGTIKTIGTTEAKGLIGLM